MIYRAQRCNIEILHSLFPECQTLNADRAISVMLWVQAAVRIVRSNAAIFRLSSAIKMTQFSVYENNYCIWVTVIQVQ